MKRFYAMVAIAFSVTLGCHQSILIRDTAEPPPPPGSITEEDEDSPKEPIDIDVKVRMGAEFSSISSNNNDTTTDLNDNIFSQQYFFLLLSAKWHLTDWIDVVPEICFEKTNFEENSTDSNIPEIVKDASTIAGKFDLIFYPFNKRDWLYIKANPDFSYVYNETANSDVIFDSFAGLGIRQDDDEAPYRGSYFEIGYGYSERFSSHNRYKANLRLMYELNPNLHPFLQVNLDADGGKGPDDIRVMYGVEIPAANIWESISTAING